MTSTPLEETNRHETPIMMCNYLIVEDWGVPLLLLSRRKPRGVWDGRIEVRNWLKLDIDKGYYLVLVLILLDITQEPQGHHSENLNVNYTLPFRQSTTTSDTKKIEISTGLETVMMCNVTSFFFFLFIRK